MGVGVHRFLSPLYMGALLLSSLSFSAVLVSAEESRQKLIKKEDIVMTRTVEQQQMEKAARAYFENVTKGNVDGILELFAEDAHVINPMTGEEGIRGKTALRAFYTNLVSSLVDYHARPTDIVIDGRKLVAPLRLEGKTKDGAPIVMNNLNFWTFDEKGKFKVLRIYMDTHPYRQALSQAMSSGKK